MPPPSLEDAFPPAGIESGRAASPATAAAPAAARPSVSADRPPRAVTPSSRPPPPPPPSSSQRLSLSLRRLSARDPPSSTATTAFSAVLTAVTAALRHALRLYRTLTPLQRVLVLGASALLVALAVLFLVYSHRLLAALAARAAAWRASPAAWLLLWLATAATAFPPLFGYSTCVTAAGFVLGFPLGWPLAASATVVGSAGAFVLTSRGVAARYVQRLVGKDKRFIALGQVLRRDGVGVLVMVRLCPLPYSLSNGFLATLGSVGVARFVLATAAATPKLLVHVFIGSRLAELAESGDKMSGFDRAVNYVGMLGGSLLGFSVGLFIYRRTMARAAELALEAELEDGEALLEGEGDEQRGVLDDDDDGPLVHPDELDAAAIMDDDDISLWDTEGRAGYRDNWDEGPVDGGINGVRK